MSGGLALFLYEVSPTGGKELGDRTSWFFAGIGAAAIVLVCLWAGKATTGPPRAAFLGVGAGIMFGVSALLTKALVHYLGDGIFAWVPHWEPYALAVAAIGGVIVAQSALQTGALGAAVGAIGIDERDLGSLILGLFVLNERVGANNAFEIFAVVVSIAMVLGGIVWLSQTQEQMIRRAGRQHRGEEPNPST